MGWVRHTVSEINLVNIKDSFELRKTRSLALLCKKLTTTQFTGNTIQTKPAPGGASFQRSGFPGGGGEHTDSQHEDV